MNTSGAHWTSDQLDSSHNLFGACRMIKGVASREEILKDIRNIMSVI